MIYRDHKNKETVTIDFRETAPGKATKDMYGTNLSEKKNVSKMATINNKLEIR